MKIAMHIGVSSVLALCIALYPLLGEGEGAVASTPEEDATEERLEAFFKEAEKRGYVTLRDEARDEEHDKEHDRKNSGENSAEPETGPQALGAPENLLPAPPTETLPTETLPTETIQNAHGAAPLAEAPLAEEASPSSPSAPLIGPSASAPAPEAPTPEAIACDPVAGFDLSGLSENVSYSDSYQLRETLMDADGTINQQRLIALSRLYLALGLETEAIAAAARGRGPEAQLVRQMALTLAQDNRRQPSYFAGLRPCNPQAALWQGLALIDRNDDLAAHILREQKEVVNLLPLPIKKQIIVLIVDLLLRQSDSASAQAYLALLDDEAIETDSQLILQRALLGAALGDKSAVRTLEKLSQTPTPARYKAMMALEGGRDETATRELYDRIALANSAYEAYELGRVVVKDYLRQGAIREAIYVSGRPEFSEPSLKEKLTRMIIDNVITDINGPENLRQLAALTALENEKTFFLASDQPTALFTLGANKALEAHYFALAKALADNIPAQHQEPQLVARLLYHHQTDPQPLYDLALAHPQDRLVSELALRQAIEQGHKDKVEIFARQLPPTQSKLLEMATLAYSHRQWQVAERFLSEALLTNKDPAPRQMLLDVQFMQRPLKAQHAYRPGEISAALMHSKTQLRLMEERLRDG